MTVSGRHCDRLVSGEFLNLFDRRAGHCQPRAERVAIAVPDVAFDLGFLKAWHKPRPSVEARTLTDEDRVCGLM